MPHDFIARVGLDNYPKLALIGSELKTSVGDVFVRVTLDVGADALSCEPEARGDCWFGDRWAEEMVGKDKAHLFRYHQEQGTG